MSTRRAPEPTTATSSPPAPRTTRREYLVRSSDPTPSRTRSGSTSTTTSARWDWSGSGRPPPTRRRVRSWRARCWPPRHSPFTSSKTPSPPGTSQAAGARRAERKGTHDYYSEFGLDTSAWNGTHFALLGDAYMRPDDLTRTARVVAMSLGQLFDATRDGTPSADRSQRGHLHRRRRRDRLQLLHRHPPGDGHRDGEDRPGRAPGGGARRPFLAGPRTTSTCLTSGRRSAPSSASPVTSPAGWSSADSSRATGTPGGGVARRSSFALASASRRSPPPPGRARPFSESASPTTRLSPGDHRRSRRRVFRWCRPVRVSPSGCASRSTSFPSICSSPRRSSAGPRPDAMVNMGIVAASGGLIPWQQAFITPVGAFQFLLGREVGVTLFGYLGNRVEGIGVAASGATVPYPSNLVFLSYRVLSLRFPDLRVPAPARIRHQPSADVRSPAGLGHRVPEPGAVRLQAHLAGSHRSGARPVHGLADLSPDSLRRPLLLLRRMQSGARPGPDPPARGGGRDPRPTSPGACASPAPDGP